MLQVYNTVAGKIVDDIAISTLSTKSSGVTLGDLEMMVDKDKNTDVFTKDKFENALKKVSRRIKK